MWREVPREVHDDRNRRKERNDAGRVKESMLVALGQQRLPCCANPLHVFWGCDRRGQGRNFVVQRVMATQKCSFRYISHAGMSFGSEVAGLARGVISSCNLQLAAIQSAILAWYLEESRGILEGHIHYIHEFEELPTC